MPDYQLGGVRLCIGGLNANQVESRGELRLNHLMLQQALLIKHQAAGSGIN